MSNLEYVKGAGIVSALFLSGTYFASTQLAIPSILGLDTAASTVAFARLYHRGTPTVVPLIVLTATCSAYLAYEVPAHRRSYLVATVAPLATLPWTTLVMMGTIKTLLALADNAGERSKVGVRGVDQLLLRWGGMNLVRTGLTFAGGVAGLWAASH